MDNGDVVFGVAMGGILALVFWFTFSIGEVSGRVESADSCAKFGKFEANKKMYECKPVGN